MGNVVKFRTLALLNALLLSLIEKKIIFLRLLMLKEKDLDYGLYRN